MAEMLISCIAIQSKNHHHTRWFLDSQSCKKKFDLLVGDPSFARSTISRFELAVDDQIPTERVCGIVDMATVDSEYEPLQRRIGIDLVLLESLPKPIRQPSQGCRWAPHNMSNSS